MVPTSGLMDLQVMNKYGDYFPLEPKNLIMYNWELLTSDFHYVRWFEYL